MSIPESIISGANPTNLPSRYEIRRLTAEHDLWIRAILAHSNMFFSPVWSKVYEDDLVHRSHRFMSTVSYLVQHSIESGMTFGIFDTQYKYKRPESAATQGKLYWDPDHPYDSPEALLEQMDFPLVSVAMSYDQIHPIDMDQLKSMIETMPVSGTMFNTLRQKDKRDPETWNAKGPGEVLIRSATATRLDYGGKSLMRILSHWLMREAALKGYRGINIHSAHDAVTKAWLHPPEPFQAEVVAILDCATYAEQDEDGKCSLPFSPSKQIFTTVYVTL